MSAAVSTSETAHDLASLEVARRVLQRAFAERDQARARVAQFEEQLLAERETTARLVGRLARRSPRVTVVGKDGRAQALRQGCRRG